MADLSDAESVAWKIERLTAHHNALRRGLDLPEIDVSKLKAELAEIAPKILKFAKPAWRVLEAAHQDSKRILFEGAQGSLLDVDHGTYPFVTSSNVAAGQASAGSGIGPRAITYVLGLVKAYTTRVGGGPFPTELHDDIGKKLGEVGREVGTNTGRARRCGWFDAVLVRQSIAISGVDGIALTKLDVLDGFPEIKICTGYKLGKQTLDYLPAGVKDQAAVTPVLRNPRRLDAIHARRALVEGFARERDQIHPPHRRTDRLPRRAGEHVSGARGRDPDARSV